MEKYTDTKDLTIDLAVKSYQIFLATLVIGPFITGRFDGIVVFTGMGLIFVSLITAYTLAFFRKKEREQ